MRTRSLGFGSAVALIMVMGAFVAACGSGDNGNGDASAASRTAQAGAVKVVIVPQALGSGTAKFRVSFDTHSVNLGFDVATVATLTVDGQRAAGSNWDGSAAGGHHRDGTLRFSGVPTGNDYVLSIDGLPKPVTMHWTNDNS